MDAYYIPNTLRKEGIIQDDATEDVMRKTKNINMSERKAPEVVTKGGLRVKSLSENSGRGLKIKSIKKS